MIIGRNLIDEEYYGERLYSTGDYELDDLLERAFCDGYEFAQREFADPVNEFVKRVSNQAIDALAAGNGKRLAKIANKASKRLSGTKIQQMNLGARAWKGDQEGFMKMADKLAGIDPIKIKNILKSDKFINNLDPKYRNKARASIKNIPF